MTNPHIYLIIKNTGVSGGKNPPKCGQEAGFPVYIVIQEESVMQKNGARGKTPGRWEDLTISNDFMFCRVMSDADVCGEFIERLLGRHRGADC